MAYRAGSLTLVLLLIPLTAGAETLVLNSGKSIQGKIKSQDSRAVVLNTGIEDESITYYRDEISKIILDDDAGELPTVDSSSDKSAEADKLENQAVMAIDEGRIDQGLDLMAQVLSLSATPNRQMNYGSILFGNGVSAFKSPERDKGLKILRESETQLIKAIKGFDANKDTINLSQCYFLLGEMYLNAFEDKVKALEFYQKSVSFYDHPAAQAAVVKLSS